MTEEQKARVSSAHIGVKYPPFSEDHKRKISASNKGKKGSFGHMGRKHSQITKDILSKKKSGIPAWNKGKSCSEETKRKISLKVLALGLKGEKSPRWKGGISKAKGYSSLQSHQRKIRKRGNGGAHSLKEWEVLKAQYNWMCPCCLRVETTVELTKDHIIPISRGGSDNIENIQPLCRSCNSRKNTKIIKYGNLNN